MTDLEVRSFTHITTVQYRLTHIDYIEVDSFSIEEETVTN